MRATDSKSLFYTPRRVFAILAGVEKAYFVAVRVFQICLAPKPGAVGGVFVELDTEGFKTIDLGVEVIVFEIEDDVVERFHRVGDVDGKRTFPVRAFEASVAWEGIDDKSKAEFLKELDRFYRLI